MDRSTLGRSQQPLPAAFAVVLYTEVVYAEATRLYRVYGGQSSQLGAFWSTSAPTGVLRSRIELCLEPAMGQFC